MSTPLDSGRGSRPAALLFDLDGTLLDTLGDITASVNSVRASLSLAPWTPPAVRACIGDGVRSLLERCLADADLAPDADELDRLLGLYRTHHRANLVVHTRWYAGVEDGLATLAGAGHRLAVVSNKPEGFTVELLRSFGCLGLFGAVLGGDSTPRKKPAPDPVLEACRRLGVRPEGAWMLGDSPGDLHAALSAGLTGRVGATWGYRDRPLLEGAPHTALVDGFRGFLDLLEP